MRILVGGVTLQYARQGLSRPAQGRAEWKERTLLSNVEALRTVGVVVSATEEFTENRIVPEQA